jgi:hypothetical protein
MILSSHKVEVLGKEEVERIVRQINQARRKVHVVDVLVDSDRFEEIQDGANDLLNDACADLDELTDELGGFLKQNDSQPSSSDVVLVGAS